MTQTERQRKRKRPPKPGDPNYMTPTQLRNARKRKQASSKKSSKQQPRDPSLAYIDDPCSAPTVIRAKEFFSDQNMDFSVHVGPLQGWRTVSKLAVRNEPLSIGLFEPQTHLLVPNSDQSPVHHDSINTFVNFIQKMARKCKIRAYNEETGSGSFKFVLLQVQRETSKVSVTVVWNAEPETDDDSLETLCHRLASHHLVHSVWVHHVSTDKHTNSIWDRKGQWVKMHGEDDEVMEYLCDDDSSLPKVPLHFAPQVFRQANLDGFTKIVARIRCYLEEKFAKGCASCVELYGGVGTIGLHLSDLFKSVIVSDENPYNQACFEKSIAKLSASNLSYRPLNADAMVRAGALQNVDVVVVDPPRKGLDDSVVQALCKERPKVLVYVSCGFAAFVRDFEALSSSFKLDAAEGHVLFPGSDAIETLAFFVPKE